MEFGPTWVIQDDLLISGSLVLLYLKDPFFQIGNIHRFQELGCGHIFWGTAVQPLTGALGLNPDNAKLHANLSMLLAVSESESPS